MISIEWIIWYGIISVWGTVVFLAYHRTTGKDPDKLGEFLAVFTFSAGVGWGVFAMAIFRWLSI